MTTARREFRLALPGGRELTLGPRTLVMGIVNVTPDSFSDGGLFLDPEAAVAHGLRLAREGADLLDIGGESTRPGAEAVGPDEQWRRIGPVVAGLAAQTNVPLSVDTTFPGVAAAALDAGAALINDVSMLRYSDGLARLAAARGAGLILMHSRGTPADMAEHTAYPAGIMEGVLAELSGAVAAARSAGLQGDPGGEQLLVDPGFGFAKTAPQSLELLARLPELAGLELPIVAGVSRKSFIGHVLDLPVEARGQGTVAAETLAALGGAHILRTHDVAACRQAVALADAVRPRP